MIKLEKCEYFGCEKEAKEKFLDIVWLCEKHKKEVAKLLKVTISKKVGRPRVPK